MKNSIYQHLIDMFDEQLLEATDDEIEKDAERAGENIEKETERLRLIIEDKITDISNNEK